MFAPGRRRIKVTRCTGDKEDSMLQNARVATRLPAQDLDRARAFYSEKLGLEPVEERPGGLLYRCGEGAFALFESGGASSGDHTQMAFEVDDIGASAPSGSATARAT